MLFQRSWNLGAVRADRYIQKRINFQLMESVTTILTLRSWKAAQLELHYNSMSFNQHVTQHTHMNAGEFDRRFSLVLFFLSVGFNMQPNQYACLDDIYLFLLLISKGAYYLFEKLFQALKQDVAVVTEDFFCSIPAVDYAGRIRRMTE